MTTTRTYSVSPSTGWTGEILDVSRAMACDVTLRVVRPSASAAPAVAAAREVFAAVERSCTRFDPQSPLMRANADPDRWHDVPSELYFAIAAAAAAHLETGGLFDPRVLESLQAMGYDRTLPFGGGRVQLPDTGLAHAGVRDVWRPGLAPDGARVRLGPYPVDLGGIGKGLAVRWASHQLAGAGAATLVEAGGDLYASGGGPDGTGWRVGVEDPMAAVDAAPPEAADPVAVLRIADRACATSSVRLRRWRVGDRVVHHLVDPRTGRPGGEGMLAVTVVASDAAWAEVWSKSLFLAGADRIAGLAEARGLAALWVRDDGGLVTSEAMAPYLEWRSFDAR
jgi:thiamine biosynthesis lipoprotein